MTRDDKLKGRTSTFLSPVRTRRRSGKQIETEKTDSSEEDNIIKEPSTKRRRRQDVNKTEIPSKLLSRPKTRSFSLDVEVSSPRELLTSKSKLHVLSTTAKSSKKQRRSPKKENEPKAVRRSHRESRKVFESLNEHTLVRSLVGDYLHPHSEQSSRSGKKRRAILEEGDTDSQGECQSGYVSMYDMIKSKTKSGKDGDDENDDDDEDDDEKDEESGSDDEDDEDDDHMPQQRYKLRENKPITDRYTAPPPKSYHNSRRGLFSSGSRHHIRESACADKQPFSPVRKKYKLKRKTINESSTSTDEDDDDRKFERRKAKSMAKARNRCLPMNLGAEDITKGILADRERIGSSLADVDPMNIDHSTAMHYRENVQSPFFPVTVDCIHVPTFQQSSLVSSSGNHMLQRYSLYAPGMTSVSKKVEITFDSIGGLGKHVRSLKEMVVFPLLYPEVFEKFKVNPPRGVLFHGPPGTGKTLMARALANECSQDGKKVAFFMRKGADCLSKWVGESERQLRLLFDQAFKMRPSIIFFDEIDGLAPVRSSRQDQIHSSIVSTLLALMDGLDNRGEIVVIGATNRIDSIDPALRRPGRFDREFIFPLPDKQARRNILSIHTKAWQPRLTQNFINEVADQCVGYCGADIKALCTEAALCALRRRYPQIYASKKKLVLDVSTVRVSGKDFAKAIKTMVPACQRAVVSPGRALSGSIRPLLHEVLRTSWNMVTQIFPPAVCRTVGESSPGSSVNNFAVSDSESSDDAGDEADIYEIDPNSSEGAREARAARAARRAGIKTPTIGTGNHFHYFAENTMKSKLVHRPRFLVCGKRGMGQSTHVSPAILHSMEHIPVHCLDLPALFGCASKTAEEACSQIFREARRVAPSVIYLPHLDSLWSTTTDTLKATFVSLVNDLPPGLPVLLFATCDLPVSKIPPDLSLLFSVSCGQVFQVPYPTAKERNAYLEPLFLTEAVKVPCITKTTKKKKPLEELPVAPAPKPRELSAAELEKMREHEENTLRELRIFLREITVKLMSDRKFKEFYKPVDLEEVPDYLDVIKNPMDLTTMLQKVDGHEYQTCAEYLVDIELITSNALEYNPNEDNLDRLIRHRACALKDCAHSLIKSQLDLDFEKACEEIVASRKRRGESRNVCAPKFLPVAPSKANFTSQPSSSSAKPEEAERAIRISRRVRGLAADMDVQLEYLSPNSISRMKQETVTEATHDDDIVEVPSEKKSSKRNKNRRRRNRFKKKSTARKDVQTVEISEPENEEINGGTEGAEELISGNGEGTEETLVFNGHHDDVLIEEADNETQNKDFDVDSVRTLSTIEEERLDKRAAIDGKPDVLTNHYINSLRMRGDVKTALKSHLDSLNCDRDNQALTDKDRLSEANLSMATSEISNCDSKDVAELDSMLSTSPHQNGLAHDDTDLDHDVIPESRDADVTNASDVTHDNDATNESDVPPDNNVTRDNDVTRNNDAIQNSDVTRNIIETNQISSVVEGDKEINSVEKSKRVLFSDDKEVVEIGQDEPMDIIETSEEDKRIFKRLLLEYVEATDKMTVETLELWHTRIRQCILQHKKDQSRLPLFENLQLLLNTLKS